MKVICFSIVPSPYQRDFFLALSTKVDLQVYYMEAESPDSPWPRRPLASFEAILPGTYVSFRGMRFFVNWKIPRLKGADVIILNGYMGNVFQWLLRFRSKSYKFIFWGERMALQPPGIKKKIRDAMVAPLRNCLAITAIGARAQSEYQMQYLHVPVYNIPYFCNLEEFQTLPLKGKSEMIKLLFCGQMIYRKGLDLLLSAFENLSGEYSVELHLVGREGELKEMLAKLPSNVKEKIIYHGFQAPERLPEFFSLADVFILPSRYDGWGVVVNQALGAGLPVICSDQVGAALDLIEDEKNGFKFKSEDAVDLRQKIKILLDRPDLIETMSKRSREKSYLLSPEKGAEQWLEVIQATNESFIP